MLQKNGGANWDGDGDDDHHQQQHQNQNQHQQQPQNPQHDHVDGIRNSTTKSIIKNQQISFNGQQPQHQQQQQQQQQQQKPLRVKPAIAAKPIFIPPPNSKRFNNANSNNGHTTNGRDNGTGGGGAADATSINPPSTATASTPIGNRIQFKQSTKNIEEMLAQRFEKAKRLNVTCGSQQQMAPPPTSTTSLSKSPSSTTTSSTSSSSLINKISSTSTSTNKIQHQQLMRSLNSTGSFPVPVPFLATTSTSSTSTSSTLNQSNHNHNKNNHHHQKHANAGSMPGIGIMGTIQTTMTTAAATTATSATTATATTTTDIKKQFKQQKLLSDEIKQQSKLIQDKHLIVRRPPQQHYNEQQQSQQLQQQLQQQQQHHQRVHSMGNNNMISVSDDYLIDDTSFLYSSNRSQPAMGIKQTSKSRPTIFGTVTFDHHHHHPQHPHQCSFNNRKGGAGGAGGGGSSSSTTGQMTCQQQQQQSQCHSQCQSQQLSTNIPLDSLNLTSSSSSSATGIATNPIVVTADETETLRTGVVAGSATAKSTSSSGPPAAPTKSNDKMAAIIYGGAAAADCCSTFNNKQLNCDFDDNTLVYRDGNLISGSLAALIQHMVPTADYYPDRSYLFAFLLSARLFIKPYELIKKICQLCELQQNLNAFELEMGRTAEMMTVAAAITPSPPPTTTTNVQIFAMHFVQLITEWIDTFPYDFRDDRIMLVIRQITQKLCAIDNTLRKNVSIMLQNLYLRLTKLNQYEEYLNRLNDGHLNEQDLKKLINDCNIQCNNNTGGNNNTMNKKLNGSNNGNNNNNNGSGHCIGTYQASIGTAYTTSISSPAAAAAAVKSSTKQTTTNELLSIGGVHSHSTTPSISSSSSSSSSLLSGTGTMATAMTTTATTATTATTTTQATPNNSNNQQQQPQQQFNDIIELCSNSTQLAYQLTHIELERLSHIGPEEFVQAFAKESSSKTQIQSSTTVINNSSTSSIPNKSNQTINNNNNHHQQQQQQNTGKDTTTGGGSGIGNHQTTAATGFVTGGGGGGGGGGGSVGDGAGTGYGMNDMKKTRNLESYIQWFNRLSYLVATEIVKYTKKKQRVRCVEYWIETARECFNIGNFNSLMAIIAGLNMSSIARLKKTWAKVQMAKFSVLEHQMDPSGNFNSYRSTLKAAMWRSAGATDERLRIVIPFFSLLVKDLYFLNEGCSNRLANGHINFEKFWQLAKQITEFIAWKQVTCPFDKLPKVHVYLQINPVLNENTLALASFECEPPENQQEKERFKLLKIEQHQNLTSKQ